MRRLALVFVLALVLSAPASATNMDPGGGGLWWRAIPGATCSGGGQLAQAYYDPNFWYPVQPYLYVCML